ncbi:MAG: bleomycin resistance family protein [Pyrinomonadaceae bacterium]|nr:bleomycin resistance family protein [Pyrinomonadaceae bacterium]
MTKLKGIVPMLETDDLRGSIEYYQSVLGFECKGVWPEEGEVCWASMHRDDAIIMLCVMNDRHGQTKPVMTGTLYLYPSDIDIAWSELKDKAKICYPIETFDYGMREFGVLDNNGYLLQFGQDLQDVN